MLWFTVMWDWEHERLGLPSSSVLPHELQGTLWAENHPELQGKMLQLGLEICCSSGVVYVPQTLWWPKWLKQWGWIRSCSDHISHGRMPRQVSRGGGSHVAGCGLGWVAGSQYQPAGLSFLLPSSWPSFQRGADVLLASESSQGKSDCGGQA